VLTALKSYPSAHWTNDPNPRSAQTKTHELGKSLFNRVEWDFFLSLIPRNLTGQRILDYGCGIGAITYVCAERGGTVLAIDQSECAIRGARLTNSSPVVRERCRFVVGRQMFGTNYDLVIAKDVIEHLPDDDAWVQSAARVLRPGGRLICSTQNQWSLNFVLEGAYHRLWRGERDWMGWDPTHVRFYTPARLRQLFRRYGLDVERWASVWIVPYNIVHWLSLLRLDVSLSSLSCVDYLLGKTFPFNRLGYSLMTVVRKS
jgi:2-polyprenyl-6-hydroxyphenyl methylase/3-demethylubiquinone-9 3-methyltransferase